MADESKRLTAYDVKNKRKGVPVYNAIINKTQVGNRATYTVSGTTKDGSTKLGSIINAAKAEAAIAGEMATKGTGWN